MKNKRNILAIFLILILGIGFKALPQTGPSADEKLLQEAKLLIFDKNWTEAERKLDELLTRYPNSSFYSQALFYRGKCLAEQKGQEREALKCFNSYLERPDRSQSLAEEAEITIIDLAFSLFNAGQKEFGQVLEEKLASSSKIIRYYAAMKMSYLRDKNLALKALPVLKKLIETEKDQEIVDRAKIALLRISPEALRNVQDSTGQEGLRLVKIRIYEKGKKTATVSINLPLSLADLAIQAIPEEEKAKMREKGYDPVRIISDLAKSKEKLVRIEEDGNIIEIWIE
ncbi:MAG: tetratricopeptide repeat protein [Candidatus Saccharicenans sp.]